MSELVLRNHLLRQIAFSRATFGPGERRQGVCDHIRKELAEVIAAETLEDAAKEWCDIVILALDGLTRALVANGCSHSRAAVIAEIMIEEKQEVNEARDWPDWRKADPNKAIEHLRGLGE
jgi:hypothetical protein